MATTRQRPDELHALEELWRAPTVPEPPPAAAPQERRPRRALPLVPGLPLAAGWIALVTTVELFAPQPAPGADPRAWAGLAAGLMLLALVAAAGVGVAFPSAGFALAVLAGAPGLLLAVTCRTSEHHAGSWWLVELGAIGALTGLAAVGLGQRIRRRT